MTFCSHAGSSRPHVGLARPGGRGPPPEVKIGLCSSPTRAGKNASDQVVVPERANRGPTDRCAHVTNGRPPMAPSPPRPSHGRHWSLCKYLQKLHLLYVDAHWPRDRPWWSGNTHLGRRPDVRDRRRASGSDGECQERSSIGPSKPIVPGGTVEGLEVAGSTGLEPAASGVTGRRSNQLNYDPAKPVECNRNRVTCSSTPNERARRARWSLLDRDGPTSDRRE